MEPIKKRRNSILKKKSSEEDTTTEIKARRISFSGKKSVKEFIAGEEAATIWGTSYEESADDLKVNSSESGLVNVHVKRIQLRNRRVVCEPQQQKRRSSLKKKILIAENDKENLCVKPNPPPVEIVQEVKPIPPVKNEQPQLKSPVKSELALLKSEQNIAKSLETMPHRKLVVDCSSICSSTFDFINFSAQINKTITIEQSLDVSLNESELQMFKFRVPVTAPEISPNTSNILCRSIMMSEDDVNILKMARKKKGEMNMIKDQIMDEELNLIETKKRNTAKIADMSKEKVVETIEKSDSDGIVSGTSGSTMDVFQIQDGKGSKRKSERSSQAFVLDSTLVEMNSPMRKKPMHTLYCSSMEATKNIVGNSSQNHHNGRPTIYESLDVDESISSNEQNGGPTIYFDSVAVEESAVGSLSGTNTPSRTLFDMKTINDSSSFPNTTASCLAMGNQTAGELEMCVSKVQENTQSNCQTIYISPDKRMEYTVGVGQQSVDMNLEHFEQTQPLSTVKHSQTIFDSSDVQEICLPINQITTHSGKQRESIYTSIYMDEESPKSTKKLKDSNTKGLKLRQTIFTPAKMIEDTPKCIGSKNVLQKTIITPINIFEDSVQAQPDTNGIKKDRQTIYETVEIKEDIISSQPPILNSNKGKRESIYTPTDMIEDSPKSNKTKESSTTELKERQVNFNPENIEEISTNLTSKTEAQITTTISKLCLKDRQTIFESADIELDTTSVQNSIPVSKKNKARHTTYMASDMIEDSPKSDHNVHRIESLKNKKIPESFCSPCDMLEESTKPANLTCKTESQRPTTISKPCVKDRQTIFESADIELDTMSVQSSIPLSKKDKVRHSIYTASDMIEDSPKSENNVHRTESLENKKFSESLYSPCEMLEESTKPVSSYTAQTFQLFTNFKSRKTIFTPEDILDDCITEKGSEDLLQKTTKIPINIFEDSLKSEPVTKSTIKNGDTKCEESSNEPVAALETSHNANLSSKKNKSRESIYTSCVIMEDSPKLTRPIRPETELDKSGTNTLSRTFFDRKTINDSSSFPNTTASYLAMGNQSDGELEMCVPKVQENTQSHCQTVYISPDKRMEYTTDVGQQSVDMNLEHFEQTQPLSIVKHSQTIFDSSDVQEICFPINQITTHSGKQRESIYTSIYMDEESPKSTKKLKDSNTKGLKLRQTIFTPAKMIEDTPKDIVPKNVLQKTIITPINIFEDSIQAQLDTNGIKKDRKTIYETVEIKEDIISSQPPILNSNKGKRESIYTPTDMIEDSPKPNKTKTASTRQINFIPENRIEDISTNLPSKTEGQRTIAISKPCVKDRQTIFESADIELDTVPVQSSTTFSNKNKARHSIYTASDMIDDSPKSDNNVHRTESLKNKKFSESLFFPCDMLEESTKPVSSHTAQTSQLFANLKSRQTIFTPEAILDDYIKEMGSEDLLQKITKIPINIFEDSLKLEPVSKSTIKNGDTKCEESSNKPVAALEPSHSANLSSKKNKSRESIYTPCDIIEDSPKPPRPIRPETESDKFKRSLTVFTTADIVEDFPKEFISESLFQRTDKSLMSIFTECTQSQPSTENVAKSRPNIHNSAVPTIQQALSSSNTKSNALVKKRITINEAVDIEEATGSIRPEIFWNKGNTPMETVDTSSDMEAAMCSPSPKQQSSNDHTTYQPIFIHEDIIEDNTKKIEPKKLLQKTIKTPINIFEDSFEEEPVLKQNLKGRQTIYDISDIEEDYPLIQHATSVSRTNKLTKSINVATEIIPKSASVPKLKDTYQSTSRDEESPIYIPSLRPKCPMTPSEVDKSLAEYLKVEAALEDQEEEIFYDAEDGTENQKHKTRQTCHVPVNILEESGMQPIQSLLKRQTTFSPKEMTNESLDHGQSKLAEKETNNEVSTIHKEAHQNSLDNCTNTLDISGLGLLEKSIGSEDLMEVTQAHDSTKNSKQILMKPRIGINFDDNTTKTKVHINRQTLHFNESINITNGSMAWKPSSAVQSVKELLLENTRLFSQSNLLEPCAFENKRSTLFFAGNDDAMDVSCVDNGPTDPESTPTKNKISRIPQLIGSAKKLESLKKSMEFIQQELPNIGCHLRNTEKCEDTDDSSKNQETPRKFSTSVPKKLEELEESFNVIELPQKPIEESRQLEEPFDTIDIPRKILSSVRKTVEESPRRDAEEFHDADEFPRRTINISPTALHESFDTVEIPRRGTTFQRNDTLYICPNEKETTINASRKSLFQFEDAPITISDVSTFFSQKLLPNANQAKATFSPNTTESLCKLNVNEIQALSRTPDSEDTTHNLAHFKKRYVELTCDSLDLSNSKDYIEKTHLSLVNTIDDESEMLQSLPQIQKAVEILSPAKEQRLKPNSSICRKCKCQRLSTTQNETTIGSFILEALPVYKVDLSELEQLAKKPNISDVGKVWRQKLRESDSFNVSDSSRSMALDDEDAESIEKLLMELADGRLANAQYRQQKRKEIKFENSFLYKVRRKMQSKSNWIINNLLLFNNVILLTHTRIRTFAILINFTPKDRRGVEVIFNDIQLKPNMLHTRQWKPFEYALHYQLLVELPFDLKKICPTSDDFFDLIDHVEKVTEDVLKTGKEMLSLILPSPASLIREPSGRLYIRKYVRTKTPQNDVKRTEIHIEVRNIKKLSYESIAMPPLYEFDEKIQLLPLGNDFLRKFLNDSLKYIKT